MNSARRILDHAQALISAGHHEDARVVLARAYEYPMDGATRAEVVASTAWVMGETGDLRGGLEHCREAIESHERGVEPLGESGRAIVIGRIAALEVRAGNDDAALPLFGDAVDLLGGHPSARGRVLINRAYLFLRRRQLTEAATDLDGAGVAFAEIGDTVEQAKVLHNRGYVDLLAGDLAAALDRMNTARETLRNLSASHRAICDLDRAEVLEAAGMVGDARVTLEEVLVLLGGTTEWHTRAEAELSLARILALEEPDHAAALAFSAAEHFREHGSDASAVRADAVGVRIRSATGVDEDVLAHAALTVERLEELHLNVFATELRLHVASDVLARGNVGDAEALAAHITVEPDAPMTTRLLTARLWSALDRRRRRPADAVIHAARSMDDFIEWQTHFGSLGLQVATQRIATDVVLQGSNAAWETRDPERVLEWSERARGVGAAWNPVKAPRDEHVVSVLAEIRSLRDSDSVLANRRRTELQEAVRDMGWRGSSSAITENRRTTLGTAEATTALDRAEADLVTYLWLGERLVALTLCAGKSTLVDLGDWHCVEQELAGLPADLDLAAARSSPRLRAAIDRSLSRRLVALDRMLVGPLVSSLGRARILLTVPGVLGGVPWGLLPSFARTSLGVAVSVDWWMGSAVSPRRSGAVGVVLGPGTENGRREADAVFAAWSGASSTWLDEDATTVSADALAARSDVLHVCAHGGHSREHPLFSSVALADGPWFGHDVGQLARVPALVVISACQMGRAVGELDTLGMARAWLHAGARCVIAAPANIDDERAADVFPAVHRRIADGTAPGDALALELHGELGVAALCYGDAW